jgi:nucleotide-binding universal stress UspA family protein
MDCIAVVLLFYDVFHVFFHKRTAGIQLKLCIFFRMKSLLVPTDFSAAADNAVLYAGQLATTFRSSIFLLHVYQVPISMNDVPVLMASVEELRQSAETGLERTKELLEKNFPGLTVTFESRLGDVVTEVEDVCRQTNPVAIIVGKHGATGVERLLFGSTSLSIIRHSQIPVLAVPGNNPGKGIKQVALAIDTAEAKVQESFIKSFASALQAELHVVHVQTDNRSYEPPNKLAAALNADCQTIRDHEFLHGIQTYTEKNNIDLLIVFPHKHSFMERFFNKTHTIELVQKLSTPIMCIPENRVQEFDFTT